MMISGSSPAKRPRGRPKNLELSDEDRRHHRRANLSAEIAERKRKRHPGSTVTVMLTRAITTTARRMDRVRWRCLIVLLKAFFTLSN